MAKRKRLGPVTPGAETRTPAQSPLLPRITAPIADVAAHTATQAAFEEVAGALDAARREGRLVQALPLVAIKGDHIVRDRMVLDPQDMQALQSSLADRGQQTPIEVVALQDGSYGLISGWRRVEALRNLGKDTVLAFIRTPTGADEAYVAMIEENEIRAGLSFYERARLTAEAVRLGIYPDVSKAVQGLFKNSSASKKSKILNFVSVYSQLDTVLQFPTHIPERLGLALAGAIAQDGKFSARLKDALRKTPAQDAAGERAALERALKKKPAATSKTTAQELAPGLFVQEGKGRVVLSGQALDAALLQDLREWLSSRAGKSAK